MYLLFKNLQDIVSNAMEEKANEQKDSPEKENFIELQKEKLSEPQKETLTTKRSPNLGKKSATKINKHNSKKSGKKSLSKRIESLQMDGKLQLGQIGQKSKGLENDDNKFYNGAILGSFLGAAVSTLVTKLVSNS